MTQNEVNHGPSEVQNGQSAMEEIVSEALRQWHEAGDLQRLAGRPLDLSDDSPSWFTTRMLKQEGFSHPALERGKDVEDMRAEVDQTAERVRRYATLSEVDASAPTASETIRKRLLGEYHDKIKAYNDAVRAYNLAVPDILHKRFLPTELLVQELDRHTR